MSVMSLYDISLNALCETINERRMEYIMKFFPPSIVFKVIWQVSYTLILKIM